MIFFLLQLAIKFASCRTINVRRHRRHRRHTHTWELKYSRQKKKYNRFSLSLSLSLRSEKRKKIIRRKPEDGIAYVNISNLCLYYYQCVLWMRRLSKSSSNEKIDEILKWRARDKTHRIATDMWFVYSANTRNKGTWNLFASHFTWVMSVWVCALFFWFVHFTHLR